MSFMQAEQQPSPWIKDLVHKLKWTYAALWTLNTTDGSRPLIGIDAAHTVAEWKDGWYNSDSNRLTRALSGNENVVRDDSRIEALFYSTYKSCSFQQGFGYVGLVLLKRESTWLTGSQEVLEHAFHTQALFLKTARIQTVMCTPWNNHVLELGKFEQESRNENVLHQIQRWLSSVTTPLNIQPSPGAVGSENDSGGSREAMQMSPSIASSMFADGSNCNVHFGPSSDILLKRNNSGQGSGAGGFSVSGHENASASSGAPGAGSRVQVQVQVRKKNGLGRYPPHSHDAISLLNRHNQDVLSQRRSISGQEKTLEASSFVEEWGPAAAGTSSIFQQVVGHDSDPIISCSGMGIPGISSLMPPDTFSQQQQQQQRSHPRGAASISLDQALLTSLPMTMATDISASLALPMDMLQDSAANLYGLHSKNSREWPTLEPSKEQSLVQMLEEFTDDDHLQRLQSPDHALIQTAVASSSDTMAEWASTGTASISHQQQHHRHYDHHTQQRLQQQQRQQQQQQQQRVVQRQFEFPNNPAVSSLQNMTTPRPALANLISHQQHQHQPQQHRPQLVPHGGGQQPQLLPLGQQQQQQQVNQPGPPSWQQNISFTTPTAWVRWVSRKQASLLRYKARDPNGASPAALRVNQMVLKRLLTEMVPKIAKEQKAREQEAGQALDTETSSHGHRVRMISYPTTTSTKPSESGTLIQDPQARTHMLAERRRRVRENEHYDALRKLIPPTSRMDKATVLAETIKLVKKLRRRVGQLEKGNPDNSGTPNLSLVTSEDSQIGTTSPSSRGEPGSPIPARTGAGSSEPELQEGKPPGGRFLDSCLVPAPAPSQEDNKEIVEVDRRACIPTELRAKIRTSHRPDTVIHILTCLKDLGLEVLSTNISIEKDWVYADFQLKMNEVHICRVSQFCEELQEAIRKAIFPAESSNADSTLDGRSHSQDS
ncbi:protein MpBHLH3 [Marchantia polymorpha subsp. ruderalis]|uniref:BHLH domain-containing protein n=1 Tax=Marchantia polymorpha TaxID=3197 RepID=A0A2R6X9G5_MARPO|nr:hypothetical protein MARPO_0028s0060 [Marchantia polymorpha]BBN00653.1 hypothetical protein Mp_2g00910 [Marchantia polymorpha subsp. ruderalis]|eukprot:PTQ42743.1 hypothetical protein MARPO_0028s0060 [Marchantia polymorpha]